MSCCGTEPRRIELYGGVFVTLNDDKIIVSFNDKPKTYTFDHFYYKDPEKHLTSSLHEIRSIFGGLWGNFELRKDEQDDVRRVNYALFKFLYGKPDKFRRKVIVGNDNYGPTDYEDQKNQEDLSGIKVQGSYYWGTSYEPYGPPDPENYIQG